MSRHITRFELEDDHALEYIREYMAKGCRLQMWSRGQSGDYAHDSYRRSDGEGYVIVSDSLRSDVGGKHLYMPGKPGPFEVYMDMVDKMKVRGDYFRTRTGLLPYYVKVFP